MFMINQAKWNNACYFYNVFMPSFCAVIIIWSIIVMHVPFCFWSLIDVLNVMIMQLNWFWIIDINSIIYMHLTIITVVPLPSLCTVAHIGTIVIDTSPIVFAKIFHLTFVNIWKMKVNDVRSLYVITLLFDIYFGTINKLYNYGLLKGSIPLSCWRYILF